MKKGIHPENYRPVVFKDMSNGDMFLTKSTCKTNETVEFACGYCRTCGSFHEPLRKTEEITVFQTGQHYKKPCLVKTNTYIKMLLMRSCICAQWHLF